MPLKPISPSEIELGRACLRKWAFRYNSDTPREESAVSAMAGTQLHAIAEAYLTTGAQPLRHDPFGEMFLEGLPHLPRPGTGTCEGRQEAMIGGLPFVFVQDWWGSSSDIPDAPPGVPATIDHKSSKDPKRYGVWGREEHLDNPQSLVYLARGAAEASESFGRWLYYQKTTAVLAWEQAKYVELGGSDPVILARYVKALKTSRKPRAIPSDVILTRDEIRGGLERVVLPIGEKLYRLREKGKLDPLTLDPNPAECDAFGGCPHKARCNLTATDTLRGYFAMADTATAPSFDLFKKLPPVNGPSAPPAAAVAAQAQTPAQTPAFVIPTWQPPQASPAIAPGYNVEVKNISAAPAVEPHAGKGVSELTGAQIEERAQFRARQAQPAPVSPIQAAADRDQVDYHTGVSLLRALKAAALAFAAEL